MFGHTKTNYSRELWQGCAEESEFRVVEVERRNQLILPFN